MSARVLRVFSVSRFLVSWRSGAYDWFSIFTTACVYSVGGLFLALVFWLIWLVCSWCCCSGVLVEHRYRVVVLSCVLVH